MNAAQSQPDVLERELKFALEPRHAALLKAHRLLGVVAPEVKQLSATYFDTPDKALAAARMALRLRRSGQRTIQTLKLASAPEGSRFARPEYEVEVAGSDLDLDHLRRFAPPDLHGKLAALQPIFQTNVQRTEWELPWRASKLSVTLDEGKVTCDAGQEPILEAEIELASGRMEDAFDFARELLFNVPLRIEFSSKAERGYRLVEGKPPQAAKGKIPKLDRKLTAIAGFKAIASSCIEHFARNQSLFLAAAGPEALHQMRVAVRRLRSLLGFFDNMIGIQQSAIEAEIERVFKRLGTARDLDVLLEALERGDIGACPAPMLDEIRTARSAAYRRVSALLVSRRVCRALLDLLTLTECGPGTASGGTRKMQEARLGESASHILKGQRKRLRQFGAVPRLTPRKRHKLRIQAKKYRYACEFFGSIYTDKTAGERRRDIAKTAEDLQESLGQLNDRAFMDKMLSRWRGGDGPDPLHDEARERDLIESAAAAQADLLEQKPFWD